MNKAIIGGIAAFVVVLVLIFQPYGIGKVKQGEEGILVDNLADGKGSIKIVGAGYQIYNGYTKDLIIYPMQLQNVSWQTKDPNTGAFSWNSATGLPFMADVGVSYRVVPGASGEIYRKYKKGLKEVTTIDMLNRLQDAFTLAGSSRQDDEIYGEGKTTFMKDVKSRLQKDFEGLFIIEKVSLKGRMVLPPTVQKGIENKQKAVQAAQQRENEIAEQAAERLKQKEKTDAVAYDVERRAKANAQARLVEAQSEAKAIKLIQDQLNASPRYVDYIKANRWDGKLPVYTNGMPMLKLSD